MVMMREIEGRERWGKVLVGFAWVCVLRRLLTIDFSSETRSHLEPLVTAAAAPLSRAIAVAFKRSNKGKGNGPVANIVKKTDVMHACMRFFLAIRPAFLWTQRQLSDLRSLWHHAAVGYAEVAHETQRGGIDEKGVLSDGGRPSRTLSLFLSLSLSAAPYVLCKKGYTSGYWVYRSKGRRLLLSKPLDDREKAGQAGQ
jgi:hypothetical protein